MSRACSTGSALSATSASRPEAAARIHEDRFQQFVREGRISDAHQIGRYAAHRRRAILVALLIDLEARLTDAVLDMADKLIGGLFARARKAKERRYVASDEGRRPPHALVP